MSTSEEAAAQRAVERFVASCAGVLGPDLVSAILHGSLAQDDFRPGASDLDVLLVAARVLSRDRAEALVQEVASADLGPAAGLDLLVVTREAAAVTSDEDPARELAVGRWLGSGAELETLGPDPHVSDTWPELSEARAHGRSLLGLGPREVIGAVPPERVRANSVGHLHRWLGLTEDAANAVFMVVTACRMWRFDATGDHVSKTAAAHWALERDPSLTGVRSALAARTTGRPVTISPAEVEAVLRRALGELDPADPA